MNEPTGAQALLIALNTPNPQGSIGIPVLLWGKPGVGKSSYIESLKTDIRHVITLIASIHDPTDFSGLPFFENGAVKYAIPEWVKEFDNYEEGVLFLDELSTAPPAVQAALLRVVLERKIGFHDLPKQVKIIAAANPPDLIVGGWELSPPLRNRFVHLDWDIEASTYIEALHEGWKKAELPLIDPLMHQSLVLLWKIKIAAFLKLSPESISGSPEENEYGFASPRTWDFVACLMASCECLNLSPVDKGAAICRSLLVGSLGESISLLFITFLADLKLADPEEVLKGDTVLDLKTFNESEIYVTLGSLNNALLNNLEHENLTRYSVVYLEIILTLVSDGKRDLVFIPLKKLSKQMFWTKVIKSSQKATQDQRDQLNTILAKIFEDEGLNGYIDVFS